MEVLFSDIGAFHLDVQHPSYDRCLLCARCQLEVNIALLSILRDDCSITDKIAFVPIVERCKVPRTVANPSNVSKEVMISSCSPAPVDTTVVSPCVTYAVRTGVKGLKVVALLQ